MLVVEPSGNSPADQVTLQDPPTDQRDKEGDGLDDKDLAGEDLDLQKEDGCRRGEESQDEGFSSQDQLIQIGDRSVRGIEVVHPEEDKEDDPPEEEYQRVLSQVGEPERAKAPPDT